MFEALKKYATFKGRASRQEYFFFCLLYFAITFTFILFEAIYAKDHSSLEGDTLTTMVKMGCFLPSALISIPRMHDLNKKGHWVLLIIINTLALMLYKSFGNKPILGENGILMSIVQFALLLPAVTVTIRRVHDFNKSGWWALITFIPFLGWIFLAVKDGTVGDNRFGKDPKGREKKPDLPKSS